MNFRALDIEIIDPPLYQIRNKVKVSKATIRNKEGQFAVKILNVHDKNRKGILKEAKLCMNLQHQNIIRSLKAFHQKLNPECVIIVMQYYPKGDLGAQIHQRNVNQNFWQQDELFSLIRTLIQTFAYLQLKGLSHRDIKPQNIFLTNQNKIKIGDFGVTKQDQHYRDALEAIQHTIRGTKFYLSPILTKAYQEYIRCRSKTHVVHNAIKSDVYSLGITILVMASLKEPVFFLNSQQCLDMAIDSIHYTRKIKNILKFMLQYEQPLRPCFCKLKSYLDTSISLGTSQRDTFELVQTFISSVNQENLNQALQTRHDLIVQNLEIPIKIEMKKQNIENFISNFKIHSLQSREDLQVFCSVFKEFGEISVQSFYFCLMCKEPTMETLLTCCRSSFHIECLIRFFRSPALYAELTCESCNVKMYLCFTCSWYYKEKHFQRRQECGHAKCRFCRGRNCLGCRGNN